MPEYPTSPNPTSLSEQFADEPKPIGFPWRLLVFSGILLGLAVFAYAGLKFGYTAYLKAEADIVDEKINQLATQVTEEDQQKFVSFYSQLANLEKVLVRHRFPSNIFTFLEKNTLGTVYYAEADFDTDENTLELKGEADSPETLVAQLTTFDKAPELDKAILNETGFLREGTSFSISLIFKPEFFESQR